MEEKYPLFARVRSDHDVSVYIEEQNKALRALHYTEHSFAHVGVVSARTAYILETLGADAHTIDLALVAAWLHDIGNIISREDHSQSGALMAFHLMNRLAFTAEDVAPVIAAIGNHDEGYGLPVSPISAALIIADKSDVRRNRVQETDVQKFDIHDRVNYSVTATKITIDEERRGICLDLSVDTQYSSISDYFEIFMKRMLLCKKAAETLGLAFHLVINEQTLM